MKVANLAELAEHSAQRLGEFHCLDIEGERFTNFQILDQARRLHAGFAELGLKSRRPRHRADDEPLSGLPGFPGGVSLRRDGHRDHAASGGRPNCSTCWPTPRLG